MEKIRENLEVLDKFGIVYHSIQLGIKKDNSGKFIYKKGFPDRFEKSATNFPMYKNIKLATKKINSYNSCIIPMGDRYNLIGIDIDNKEDTLDRYQEICNENNFDRLTFTMKTMHNGYHEYYHLTDDQRKQLVDLTSLDGKLFGLHIDVKYNNQVLFGPSYINEGEEYFYEILLDIKPCILPEFIFNEILKFHDSPKIINNKKLTNKSPEKNKSDTINISNDNDIRLELYLECLNETRFEDYNDWIKIGYIIYNEKGSCKLWDKFSKKAKNYDNSCYQKWKTFNDDNDKMARIKELIEFAKSDNYSKYKLALLKDKIGILDDIFQYGANDLLCAYLFYCLNPQLYIYDMTDNVWYKINEYGIFEIDHKNILLKNNINNSLLRTIEVEFISRNKKLTDETMKTKLVVLYAGIRKYLTCNNKKDGIIDELSLLYKQSKVFEKLNNVNDYLVAFDNGVYDLKTFKFRNAKYDELISCTTGYALEDRDEKTIKEVYDILFTIMPNHEELVYLLKTISIGLIGSNLLEEFYIWIGKGQNGKGLLRDLIAYTFGNYFDNMEIDYLSKTSYPSNSNSADPVMARKKDSRIVITTEPEKDVNIRCGKLKQISGRDFVQVRELYKKPFNFIPKFKLIIQTNDEINIDGSDQAITRRLRFIKFPIRFVDKPSNENERQIKRDLKDQIKLQKKYRIAFFYILLDKYTDFVNHDNNRLDMPLRIKNDTKSYLYENDPVSQFFDEKIIKTNNNSDVILLATLYNNFLEHNTNNNDISAKKFKSIILDKGINCKKTMKGVTFMKIKFANNDDNNDYNKLLD